MICGFFQVLPKAEPAEETYTEVTAPADSEDSQADEAVYDPMGRKINAK